jgi:hypothetical protein
LLQAPHDIKCGLDAYHMICKKSLFTDKIRMTTVQIAAENYLTSNFTAIDQYIEKNIENKINQLFEILPPAQSSSVNIPRKIYEYTIYELYQQTIQTIIDIINDFTALYSQRKYMDEKAYRQQLFQIFLSQDRRIYIGIFLVFLSLIFYFLDAADI